MNARTESISKTFKPQVAIMVYRSTDDVTGSGQYYLESHTVNEAGQIMEGKPLQQEIIQEMVDVFFDERKHVSEIKGLVPDNLLAFQPLPGGNYKMIWYRPAEVRVLHHATQLKLPTTKAWVPAMLYRADKNSLDVFALKANTRPKEITKLFKAPFFNVADDGDVCLGNAKVKVPKEKIYSSMMKYWEDLFWLSEFSHVNGTEKVKSKSLQSVWKTLLASKTKLKWSDLDELISCNNKSLKSLL